MAAWLHVTESHFLPIIVIQNTKCCAVRLYSLSTIVIVGGKGQNVLEGRGLAGRKTAGLPKGFSALGPCDACYLGGYRIQDTGYIPVSGDGE